jgi:spermidine/putrescine transport system substrate-binding protein
MKGRLIVLLSVLAALSLVLTACGGQAATPPPAQTEAPAMTEAPVATEAPPAEVQPAQQIVIYNWSEYIDPEIYTDFETQTGIKVVEDNFSSNEEMLAKLQGGATGYSLIVPSDYTVTIMKQGNMLAKLDHANIPNLANLSEDFQNVPYDPGNEYCAPYQWGTTGIGYLSDQMDEPTSWSVLFNPDPSSPMYGRTTMLDDAREAFAAALIYLGYDPNTTDEAQLEQAKQLLIQAKPALSGYDSDTYEDLLASGENIMAHGWNGDFLVAQEDNENIAYTIPQEGGVIWVDNICIPATVTPEEKLAAEMFINFLLTPEMGAKLSEFNYYASPNKAAEALLGEDFLSDPAVYPSAEVRAKLHYLTPVGDAESTYQRLWDEVKSAQ